MVAEARETLAPPIAIFDAEPLKSIVLKCVGIIFNRAGPHLEIQGVVFGAQSALHYEFRGRNGSNQLEFNCA